MLYANVKGQDWQRNWVITCAVYIVIDILIRNVNIVFVIYYYIPELIARQTRLMKVKLNRSIHNLVVARFNRGRTALSMQAKRASNPAHSTGEPDSERSEPLAPEFSVTDYMFVSAHVARAYPHLLESCIVNSYRSLMVSDAQAGKWAEPSSIIATVQHQQHQQQQAGGGRWNWSALRSINVCDELTKHIPAILMSMFITLGCQNITVQTLIVLTIDPILVGIMAFFGSVIFHNSMFGVFLLAGVVFLLVILFARWLARDKPISPALSADLEAGAERQAQHRSIGWPDDVSLPKSGSRSLVREGAGRIKSDHEVAIDPGNCMDFDDQSFDDDVDMSFEAAMEDVLVDSAADDNVAAVIEMNGGNRVSYGLQASDFDIEFDKLSERGSVHESDIISFDDDFDAALRDTEANTEANAWSAV